MDLQYLFRISPQAIGNIVKTMSTIIYKTLKNVYLQEPSVHTWKKIEIEYMNYRQISNCLGSIDGKHVRLQKPANKGSLYYNYKHFHSLVLMACVDANYLFTIIDVGACGSANDNAIFRNSAFGKLFFADRLHIPMPEPYPNDDVVSPYFFIADEAFPLLPNLMRPFSGKSIEAETSQPKRIFNYRIRRARLNVECAFGMLRSKLRLYYRPLATTVNTSIAIVQATCILHNYVRMEDRPHVNESDISQEFKSKRRLNLVNINTQRGNTASFDSTNIRNHLMEYFMSPAGAVPWQQERITITNFN